ncbi:IstB domain-containing protein ATP-binding protein [Clostridium botulinum B str. Osaka05]|uniref:IstB domain-containing protein ATP-binding protein n=1 Tax=Clostridium botulinum B str. Osaka05 TaxID=1407017 RepID=A0A0S6U161_CLOBO|nr:ATP-binding protein [Clostridium botulinum]GAE00677.1 IstB domain-containing protein ATP-binding protein [Clostridium botulinum B str. Osaka05]
MKSDACKHLSDDQINNFIKENILFYGTLSVGKTHLATAIGIEATSKGYLTYFISYHE